MEIKDREDITESIKAAILKVATGDGKSAITPEEYENITKTAISLSHNETWLNLMSNWTPLSIEESRRIFADVINGTANMLKIDKGDSKKPFDCVRILITMANIDSGKAPADPSLPKTAIYISASCPFAAMLPLDEAALQSLKEFLLSQAVLTITEIGITSPTPLKSGMYFSPNKVLHTLFPATSKETH